MGSAETYRALTAERSRWIGLVDDLVAVDSGPGDRSGAAEVADVLLDRWRRSGFDVEVVPHESPLLIARHRAPAPAVRLLLVGHYDTVFPAGTAAARPFAVGAGGRATGPGAADMKAGLAIQLAAVWAARAAELDLDITVLVNGDEESGSIASRSVIEALARTSDLALVFEPCDPDGALVLGRPGVRRFRVETTGRAAHTGVDPETGRNAIEGMARVVVAVQSLECPERGTVAVTQIAGGSRPNVVPAAATAVIDARARDAGAFDQVEAELQRIVADTGVQGVTAVLERLEERPPFSAVPQSIALARRLGSRADEIGVHLAAREGQGSSDGNLTAGAGVPTLDGLGPGGGGLHSPEEWFDVDSFFQRAALVAVLLEDLARPSIVRDEALGHRHDDQRPIPSQ